jgi:tetratricopeptide (TPR) repeat protein
MPEDLLSGVLGGEEEQPEAEAPGAVAGAEAFAAAIAAIASRQDPGVARKTEVFLEEQTLLLKTQRHHLEEEHASRLRQLRLAVGAAKRRRFADLLRNCLYGCLALLALGVLFAVLRMTYQALSDHGLVVEDFTVPSDFAARGITSQALAEDLASRVAIMRETAARVSLDQVAQVRADQSGYLKVQIPETGISVDELERFLHRWLGQQTVLSGEVSDEPGGQLAVILHVGSTQRIEVRGAGSDLDGLMQKTAEKAFEIFSPENFVQYLMLTRRYEDGWNALERYADSPAFAALPRPDRADFESLYAFDDPDRHRALTRALISIDIDPRVLVTWRAAAWASGDLGHDQAAIDFYRRALTRKKQDLPLSQRAAYPYLLAELRWRIDWALGDFATLDAESELVSRSAALGDRYAVSAEIAAGLHDLARSNQQLARALAASPADTRVREASWYVSSSAGNWPQALAAAKALVADTEAQKAAAPTPEFAGRPELAIETQYDPWLAYAEAMAGDIASATALISQTPTDCYLCVRTRAKIAAAAGDAAAADRWFAEAVRQAPDLPAAYDEWGHALLARGTLADAAREFELAHQKGPHFADALEAWGDVLVKQGHLSQALEKYDEALQYAPNWAALKQARGAAAKPKA